MKKHVLFILSVVFLEASLFGQADPHFSLFEYTQNIVNPAAAGSNDAMCFTTSHRQQWVGFGKGSDNDDGSGNGRPISTIFSFDMPLPKIKSGLGLAAIQDKIGFQNDIQIKLNYAFRYPLKENVHISGGIGLGVVNRSINPDWVTSASLADQQVYGDPSLPHMENITVFDMNAGVGFYGTDYWVSFSATHITGPKLKYNIESYSRLAQQLYLMGGYTFHLSNPSYDIITSAAIQADRISKMEFQVNAKFLYDKKFWFGVSGRIDAIAPMIGAHLPVGPGALSIGYSYDIRLNKIGAAGSHEIMARYCFNLSRDNSQTRGKTVRRM